MTIPKISWSTVIISAVVAIVVGFLFLWIFVFPSDSSLKELVLQKEKSYQLKIDSLKQKEADQNKVFDQKLNDYLSYQEAYGLVIGEETKLDIPKYIPRITVSVFYDEKGNVLRIDTAKFYNGETLVPPVLNWRVWKSFENVPTRVVSSDTTSGESEGERYFSTTYTLEPTFGETSVLKVVDTKKETKPVAKPAGKIVF